MQKQYLYIAVGAIFMIAAFGVINSIRLNSKLMTNDIAKAQVSSTQTSEEINDLKGFSYPNSLGDSPDKHLLILTSTDSAKVITDWYKQKLSEQGYSVSNFVSTSNNNNIANLLEAQGKDKVSIKVKRYATESATNIEVHFN